MAIWCWMTPIFTTHKHFHMIFSVSLLQLILFYWETSFCIWNPTKIHNSVEFWLSMQSLKLSELSPHSDFISGGIQLSKVNESSSKIYLERRISNGWKRVQHQIMSLFTFHWKLSAWKFSYPLFHKEDSCSKFHQFWNETSIRHNEMSAMLKGKFLKWRTL